MTRNIISVSGEHFFQESGAYLASGLFVDGVSGVFVNISGAYLASGLFVDGVSGVHVYQESGAFVTTYGDMVQNLVELKNQDVLMLLENIYNELKIIRMQLSLITSNEISKEEIE